MAFNLYDLTKGNYRIVRTITYPDFPDSKIETNAQVKAAKNSEWETTLTINGKYTGPSDVVSAKDYIVNWTSDGKNILETASATLVLSSGGTVRQVWSSTITPGHAIEKFPQSGEVINITVSPFQRDGNRMSYKWEGTVKVGSKEYPRQ